jgi:hypothetical protein
MPMRADKPTMPTTATPRPILGALAAILAAALAAPAAGGAAVRESAPDPEAGAGTLTPKTLITYGPAFKTRKRKVEFRFTDATEQPGSSFRCAVDGGGWHGCRSPLRLSLGDGSHVLLVSAVNAEGVGDPRPAVRRFEVIR